MRRILRKDLVREVKKSFARFISIAILVGMGTTFFIGLNSAAPNMLQTGDQYFKENNYQDIKVMAPVAFEQGDIEEMADSQLVKNGTLGYLVQTLTEPGNLVIELLSFQANHFKLVEGRYPQKSGELVLDNKARKHYKLGEKIKFHLGDGAEEEALNNQEYELVGFVENPRFISQNARGVASVGNGSLDIYGAILEDDFTLEAPNTIDLQLVDATREKFLYGSGYEKDLQAAKLEVEKIVKKKVEATSLEITDELADKEVELAEQKSDLTEKKDKLNQELTNISIDKKQTIAEERTTALSNQEEAMSQLRRHQADLLELEGNVSIAQAAFQKEYKWLDSVDKQLATQRDEYNRRLAEENVSEEELLTLEGEYLKLYTSYEAAAALQGVESGKLTRLKEEALKLSQLVQVEQATIPDVETLKKQFADLEKERATAQKKIEDRLDELSDGITELTENTETVSLEKEKAQKIPYNVEGIDDTETFTPFYENVKRLDVISQVIPFIFFFVAFIITTTLILRMIHQSREQIGTLLAIGISRQDIIRKYTLYSVVSSTIGMLVGIYAGIYPFTQVIISLYSPMYIFPAYESHLHLQYIVIALIATVLSVVVIPYFVYSRLFKFPALQLIRPKEAKSGRKLFIERWPSLWKKIPFYLQRTIRNIMTYKVRMGILLLGFIGCMSLLFVGYGARSSVDQLQEKQFYDVLRYDALVALAEVSSDEDKEAYKDYLVKEKKAKQLPIFQEKWESVTSTNGRVETYLISPEKPEKLSDYIKLTDVQTAETLKLKANDVFVTEKLANVLKLKVGDSWEIVNSEGLKISPKITKIVKNYYLHYAYFGDEVYEELFHEPAKYGSEFINVKEWTDEDSEELLNLEAVSGIHTRNQEIDKMNEMTAQLNTLIIIIIVAAVLLGLVVLYNLAYITILERKQEIAVIRVMGYRQKQVTRYIFREIFLLGIIGIFAGTFTGVLLHKVVMKQVELEFLFFPEMDFPKVFAEAGVTLVVIAFFLLLLMHHKIKQINTVEALKVRE